MGYSLPTSTGIFVGLLWLQISLGIFSPISLGRDFLLYNFQEASGNDHISHPKAVGKMGIFFRMFFGVFFAITVYIFFELDSLKPFSHFASESRRNRSKGEMSYLPTSNFQGRFVSFREGYHLDVGFPGLPVTNKGETVEIHVILVVMMASPKVSPK